MVGIHARTGREKIFARNVAHVLNDETQRKYIQVSLGLFSFKFIAIMSVQLLVEANVDREFCWIWSD